MGSSSNSTKPTLGLSRYAERPSNVCAKSLPTKTVLLMKHFLRNALLLFAFLLCGVAFGSETPDASSSGTTALTGSSMTWNHTVTSSLADPAIVVAVACVCPDGDSIIQSVTYNGVALTPYARVRDFGGSELFSNLYVLAGPSTGTHAVLVTFSTALTDEIVNGASFSATGIHQTAPVRFPNLHYTSINTSTTDAVDCADNAVSGDLIVGMGIVHAATITATGSPQVAIFTQNAFGVGTNTSWGAGYIPAASGTSLNWSQSPAGVASAVCVALRPDTETLNTPIPNNLPMTTANTSVSSLTISNFTVSACTDPLLIVNTSYWGGANNRSTSSVTFNGVNLTSITSRTDGGSGNHKVAEVWALVNPPAMTANIVVTFSGAGVDGQIGARAFCYVNQTSTFGTPATAGNLSSASPTVTVTSNTGAVVVDSLYFDDGSSKPLFATGAQSWYSSSGGSTTSGSSQVKQGAATVAMTYTPNDPFTMVGVGINFDGGSGNCPHTLALLGAGCQ